MSAVLQRRFGGASLSRFALGVLYGLMFLILFYRAQKYLMVPFGAPSRLAVYGVLFASLLLLRRHLGWPPLAFAALFWSVGIAALQTLLLSGPVLAVHATGRFVNVMLLAPCAALLFASEQHIEGAFRLLWVLLACALGTVIYQFAGGRLDTLVEGYVAIRGDLVRHMSLVGEPNVGGMLAVLSFVSSILLIRSRAVAVLFGSLAVVLIFMSISKAALIGSAVAAVGACVVLKRDELTEAVTRAIGAAGVGLVSLWLIGAQAYAAVSVDSLLGRIRGEPSVAQDFVSRQGMLSISPDGPSMTAADGDLIGTLLQFMATLLQYAFGTSFSRVGSAAQEILGPNAGVVLPHNSYLELFLVGGLLMLGAVAFLMIRAFSALWQSRSNPSARVDRCALVCLFVLACWMLVYPVIYEPVTGLMFWVIVGYGNRRAITGRPAVSN